MVGFFIGSPLHVEQAKPVKKSAVLSEQRFTTYSIIRISMISFPAL